MNLMRVMRSLLKLITLTMILVQLNDARNMMRESNACEARQSPGPVCETCELLATCVSHSNGWVNIPVESCDMENGFYCNAPLGMCSNSTGPCHPFGYEANFPCTSHGVFPDPYDCQKYHMCYFVGATLVSATVKCDNDKAFDAANSLCSLTLKSDVCQQIQFECLKAGEAKPWPNSPNIFYVCKATFNENVRVLYPTLYRCDDGDIFKDYYCSPSSNSNSSNLSSQPNKASTQNGINTSDMQKCFEVGLMPDRNNCRKYYYCSAVNGMLRQMECPAGSYFNINSLSCIVGSC